jgi:hypothetical protein
MVVVVGWGGGAVGGIVAAGGAAASQHSGDCGVAQQDQLTSLSSTCKRGGMAQAAGAKAVAAAAGSKVQKTALISTAMDKGLCIHSAVHPP